MKTLLITGANRGIGLEFCNQYAADGWRVLACCRDPGKADALNKLAARYPDLIKLHALDVTNHVQIEQLARTLSDETIDLLINDAGVYPSADKLGFGHTDYAEWMAAFNINTMAPLKMVEAFVQQIARSQLKLIVTITSQMGSIDDNGSGGSYLYRSSKAAANMVVKSLAVDLKDKGIISVAFNPGWVKTDMGGPDAPLDAVQSIAGLRARIAELGPTTSGRFVDYAGAEIGW
jgi:NAD(P)-dependent dehydrogenase (short-subunit alcohol dehydrogenase family)